MKKLLFVDPNKQDRERHRGLLGSVLNDWELRFAVSATEALELCEDAAYDVMVSANRLPDLSGGALFNAVKELHPETLRVFLIEQAEAEQFKGFVNAAQLMMVKPLNTEEFARQVDRAFKLRAVIHNPAVIKLMGGADALPSLPRVFQRVTQKLNDPNASLADVARIVAEDIVLSSKILKLSNSALFNLETPATDIAQAVGLLGSKTISSLVLSEGLSSSLGSGATAEELNRHSIACGAAAALILTKWKAPRAVIEQATLCGIVHDIGKLVLAEHAPEEWKKIAALAKQSLRSDVQIERDILGVSHCEMGAYLLAVWGFSDDVVAMIAFHHEPSRINHNNAQLLLALHLAENLSPTKLHGEELDWYFLEENGISEKEVNKLKVMISRRAEKPHPPGANRREVEPAPPRGEAPGSLMDWLRALIKR